MDMRPSLFKFSKRRFFEPTESGAAGDGCSRAIEIYSPNLLRDLWHDELREMFVIFAAFAPQFHHGDADAQR